MGNGGDLVSFLGNQQGTGHLLSVLRVVGWGVWSWQGRREGNPPAPPPPEPSGLLNARGSHDEGQQGRGRAREGEVGPRAPAPHAARATQRRPRHPRSKGHLIRNCHTRAGSAPAEGVTPEVGCEHQRLSRGRETEARRGRELGPLLSPPPAPVSLQPRDYKSLSV